MLFDYKAVSIEGRMVFGRIDAINIVDLEMRLKRMDLDLVSGNPVNHQNLFGSRKIPRRELINFCFHVDQPARWDGQVVGDSDREPGASRQRAWR